MRGKKLSKNKITVAQAVPILNIKERRIRVLCAEGRIAGAEKIGRDWLLPASPVISAAGRSRPGKAPIGKIEK